MSKKDLQHVDYGRLADLNPANPPRPVAVAVPRPATRTRSYTARPEGVIQFSFGLRKSLRKQLAALAADADMTMRAFVLAALAEKGLAVREEDLLDLRRR